MVALAHHLTIRERIISTAVRVGVMQLLVVAPPALEVIVQRVLAARICYADVPCNSNEAPYVPPQPVSPLSKYCGTSFADAAENCWQPCRDDSDCCFDQT
jgi:hypothetical protein